MLKGNKELPAYIREYWPEHQLCRFLFRNTSRTRRRPHKLFQETCRRTCLLSSIFNLQGQDYNSAFSVPAARKQEFTPKTVGLDIAALRFFFVKTLRRPYFQVD